MPPRPSPNAPATQESIDAPQQPTPPAPQPPEPSLNSLEANLPPSNYRAWRADDQSPIMPGDTRFTTLQERRGALQEDAERQAIGKGLYDEGWLFSTLRNLTALTDARYSEEYREGVRGLRVEAGNEQSPFTLDAIRDVFLGLRQQIHGLSAADGFQNAAALASFKKQANEDIDALIKRIGLIGYDTSRLDQARTIAGLAAPLCLNAVPFATTSLKQPADPSSVGGLSNNYTRAASLMAGLMRNSGTTVGMGWEHFRERQLSWIISGLINGIPTYLQEFAKQTGREGAAQIAEDAKDFIQRPDFLAGTLVVGAAVYVLANHGGALLRRWNQPDNIGNPPTTKLDDIRNTFALGVELLDSLEAFRNKWEGKLSEAEKELVENARTKRKDTLTEVERNALFKHEVLAASEKALHRDARNALGNLYQTLEHGIGIKDHVSLLDESQRQEKNRALASLMPVAVGLTALIAVSSMEKRDNAMTANVTTMNNIAYYGAATGRLLAEYFNNTLTASDLNRTVSSLFAGATSRLLPGLINFGLNTHNVHGLFSTGNVVADELYDVTMAASIADKVGPVITGSGERIYSGVTWGGGKLYSGAAWSAGQARAALTWTGDKVGAAVTRGAEKLEAAFSSRQPRTRAPPIGTPSSTRESAGERRSLEEAPPRAQSRPVTADMAEGSRTPKEPSPLQRAQSSESVELTELGSASTVRRRRTGSDQGDTQPVRPPRREDSPPPPVRTTSYEAPDLTQNQDSSPTRSNSPRR